MGWTDVYLNFHAAVFLDNSVIAKTKTKQGILLYEKSMKLTKIVHVAVSFLNPMFVTVQKISSLYHKWGSKTAT